MFKKSAKIILAGLKKLPWRTIVVAGLVVCAAGYGLWGWEFSKRTASIGAKSEAQRFLDDQVKKNPVMADKVSQLRSEYGEVALATKLRLDAKLAEENIYNEPLAIQLERNAPIHEAVLINLVQATGMRPGDPDLDLFLTSYDSAIRMIPDPEQRVATLSSLKEVSQSPADWQLVRTGYHALLAWRATRETPELWALYKQENDWLADILLQRIALEVSFGSEMEIQESFNPDDRIRELLTVASHHKNMLKTVYDTSPEQAILAYHIFELYGDTLSIATERYGLPLLETLDVIYANPDTLQDYAVAKGQYTDAGELQAAFLNDVYKQNQSVWLYARTTPLALQLFLDARQNANAVLERYGDNEGFLLQLYESYRDEGEENALLLNAIAALAEYEDVAAVLLFDYRDNMAFKNALVHPEIGSRIIPYAARFPETITEASNDPGYVNKYFDEQGRLKDPDRWWEALPGGSVAKVAANMAKGYPCSWSELGWAAFDTVDVGLMIFTLGTSKVVTTAGKTAVKGSARVASAALRGADTVVKSGKKLPGALTRKILAQADSGKGIKQLFPFLRGTATKSDDLVKAATKTSKGTLLGDAANWVKSSGDDLAEKIGRSASPENIKKWRLLGYGLAFVKVYTRRDLLKKAPEQLGENVADVFTWLATAPGKVLASAFQEMLQNTGIGLQGFPVPLVHIVIVLALLSAAGVVWRLTRPKHVNPL